MSAQSTTTIATADASEVSKSTAPSSTLKEKNTEDEKMEMWYPTWRIYHTYAAAGISVLVALCSSISKIADTSITQQTEMVLLIVCVGLLGIPHGASDHVVIANTLHSHVGNFWLPAFLVVYLGLVGAVLYFWHLTPCVALFTFIAVSAIHFGLGDVDKEMAGHLYWLEVPIRGFMIMVLPCVHHTHNVDRIWTWLVGDEEQNKSVQDALVQMHMLMPIWYVGICAVVIWHQYHLYMAAKDSGMMSFHNKADRTRADGVKKFAEGVAKLSQSPTFKTVRRLNSGHNILRRRVPEQSMASRLAAAEAAKKEEKEEKTPKTLQSVAAGNGKVSDAKQLSKQSSSSSSSKPVDDPNHPDHWDVLRQKGWVTGPLMSHHAIVIELFSIYALFASTTPLVAFIVYFCIWHSARHNFMVAATCFDRKNAIKALSSFFWASVPFSLGALAMGYAGFVYMHDEPENVVKVQLRMVFIGLNALTIPHMMFIEMSDLRGRVAEGKCANFIGMVMGTINMRSVSGDGSSGSGSGSGGSGSGSSSSSVGKKMSKTSPRIP